MGTIPAQEENVWEVFNNHHTAQWEESPAGLRNLIGDRKRELPGEDQLILEIRLELACTLRDTQEFQTAYEEFKDLLAIQQRLNGPFHRDCIGVVKELADLLVRKNYRKHGKWEEADALVRDYRSDLEIAGATSWPDAKVDLDMTMGHVLVQTTMFDERLAEIPARIPLLKEAMPILESALQGVQGRWPLGKDTIRLMSNLAVAYRRITRAEDAWKMQEDVLRRTREKCLDRNVLPVMRELSSCGGFAASAGQYERSEAVFRECLSRLEMEKAATKPSHDSIGFAVMSFGQLLEHLDRMDEARELGLKYLDRLLRGNHIALGCIPSFQPEKATWLPKKICIPLYTASAAAEQ